MFLYKLLLYQFSLIDHNLLYYGSTYLPTWPLSALPGYGVEMEEAGIMSFLCSLSISHPQLLSNISCRRQSSPVVAGQALFA